MGGQIDWAAVPLLVEMWGVRDVEIFMEALFAVRDVMSEKSDGE